MLRRRGYRIDGEDVPVSAPASAFFPLRIAVLRRVPRHHVRIQVKQGLGAFTVDDVLSGIARGRVRPLAPLRIRAGSKATDAAQRDGSASQPFQE